MENGNNNPQVKVELGNQKAEQEKKYRIKDVFVNGLEEFKRFFTFRKYFFVEAQQEFRKLGSEFIILKQVLLACPQASNEQKSTIEEIDKLFKEAHKKRVCNELWSHIHLIELRLIQLYDIKSLKSYISVLHNNIKILSNGSQKRWENKLKEFENEPDDTKIDVDYMRKVIYRITEEINEFRRAGFMKNSLKQALMKRYLRITIIIGLVSWIFTYLILRDALVHYAVVLGVMGGFFSRVLSIQSLEFEPHAFSLISLSTYTQPILGGLGALVIYLILISPIGPDIFSSDTFYLNAEQTTQYFHSSITNKPTIFGIQMPLMVFDDKSAAIVISKYPKPGLLLFLAFFAGFSERWLLITLKSIVGKKIKKHEDENKSDNEVIDSSSEKQS